MAHILIIEDDEAVRRPLQIFLERAGHEVGHAPDGQIGVRLWRERGGDLVITDIHMPNKDGIQTILELRTLCPTLPIIAMSGGDQTKHLDLLGGARMLGAVYTVPKPFTLQEVLTAVQHVLSRPDQSTEEIP